MNHLTRNLRKQTILPCCHANYWTADGINTRACHRHLSRQQKLSILKEHGRLKRLSELRKTDPAFKCVNLNYRCEFWDAIRLGQFDDPDEGFGEISKCRTYNRCSLPSKAMSTVHQTKGFECSDVLIMPCDAKHFGNSLSARCRLYVTMSRAKCSLTFVVSHNNPSPLVALARSRAIVESCVWRE